MGKIAINLAINHVAMVFQGLRQNVLSSPARGLREKAIRVDIQMAKVPVMIWRLRRCAK
ncbi:hypothetical protein Plhal304r1_c025g0086411 [Plasmopara halstedii]